MGLVFCDFFPVAVILTHPPAKRSIKFSFNYVKRNQSVASCLLSAPVRAGRNLLMLFGFSRKGSVSFGLGIAVMMYFLNLIANIADVAEFLKYITPFGYCEGADIVSNGSLDCTLVAIGIVLGIGGIIIAFLKYTKIDIH